MHHTHHASTRASTLHSRPRIVDSCRWIEEASEEPFAVRMAAYRADRINCRIPIEIGRCGPIISLFLFLSPFLRYLANRGSPSPRIAKCKLANYGRTVHTVRGGLSRFLDFSIYWPRRTPNSQGVTQKSNGWFKKEHSILRIMQDCALINNVKYYFYSQHYCREHIPFYHEIRSVGKFFSYSTSLFSFKCLIYFAYSGKDY